MDRMKRIGRRMQKEKGKRKKKRTSPRALIS